jgi:hypothetical protein
MFKSKNRIQLSGATLITDLSEIMCSETEPVLKRPQVEGGSEIVFSHSLPYFSPAAVVAQFNKASYMTTYKIIKSGWRRHNVSNIYIYYIISIFSARTFLSQVKPPSCT